VHAVLPAVTTSASVCHSVMMISTSLGVAEVLVFLVGVGLSMLWVRSVFNAYGAGSDAAGLSAGC
jgi:hypothetical protein